MENVVSVVNSLPKDGLFFLRLSTLELAFSCDLRLRELAFSCTFTDNELYKAILFDKLDVNEGMIMENIVAQMLRRNGHKLYFYSRSDSSNRENHMEIDFLITEKKDRPD